MADNTHTADFPESSCVIAFIYPEIGNARDIPCVYWDNRRWMQLLYDAFRETWSNSHPILHGGREAIATHFGLDPSACTVDEIASASPEDLRSRGNGETDFNAFTLAHVIQYAYWSDLSTKEDYMAELFDSGSWCLARLDKAASRWDIEGMDFSDGDINARYMEHYPDILLLGGIPPTGKFIE